MQIYLHHYIWYIFSSATIPIINFRGIVNFKNEHLFFVYSIRTRVREHTFVFTQPHTIVKSQPLSINKSCEKAAFRELQGSCIAHAGAAKKLRFISASKKLHFCLFLSRCAQNLTKKFKFFQEKAITF